MKQFSQFLVLILLSAHFHVSASNINRNDTISKFNEITDIEAQLRNILDTAKTPNQKVISTQDTTIKINVDSIVLTPSEAVIKSKRDSIDETLDALFRASQDTIILRSDTIVLTPPDSISVDSIITDSIKIDLIDVPEKTKPVFKRIIVKTSLDSIYSRRDNGIIQLPQQIESVYTPSLNFKDTMLYNPLFLPIVFSGRIESPDSASMYLDKKEINAGILISSDKTFQPLLEKQAFIDKVRRNYYLENPTLVRYSASSLNGARQTATDTEVREKFNPFKELLSSETSFSLEKPDVEGVKIERLYWKKSGDHSFQLSQNYFSPNWHRGGTSNLNINSYQVFRANYSKDKVRFNNMLEWRLSLYNAPDDSIRDYRIGDDLLRYYGDFGIDAFKKTWSYSTNLEAKTQIFTSHIPNTEELRSAFLAPLYVNAGIGMKYNLDKRSESVRHRRLRLSIDISPLSINYKYVGNSDVNEKRFGIPEGKKSIFDKGSTVTSSMIYDITKYITWNARMKYFTNYSKVETELENTLNMSLSRFFSTRLYLHLRYDDGVPKDEDYGFLQVSEVVSFGLNFKW